MKNVMAKISLGLILLVLQIWFSYIMLHSPSISLDVAKNVDGNWIVADIYDHVVKDQLSLQTGDIIKYVNGKNPASFDSIQKWHTIYSADEIIVNRNGKEIIIHTDHVKNSDNYDLYPLLSEALCLIMAILLYRKASSSPSARLLSSVFFVAVLIYMSLVGSIRGDTFGKIMMFSLIMVIPVVFLHFFIVFFMEKGNIRLNTRFIRFLYVIPILFSTFGLLMFFPSVSYPVYVIVTDATILFFILGIISNLVFVGHIYRKYKQVSSAYFRIILKTILYSMFVSFAPFTLLYFLPLLFKITPLLSSLYSGWFILIFPVSFAYLIIAKRLYDIDIVLRRLLLILSISVFPSLLLVGLNIFFTNRIDVMLVRITLSCTLTLSVVAVVLYSFEYLTGKLEPLIFPRKYALKAALDKIAGSMSRIESLWDLKDIVLSDIKKELDVDRCAIVFRYESDSEVISDGDFDTDDINARFKKGKLNDDRLTFYEINRHLEYSSYFVIGEKINNTLLNKEELQWLQMLLSYLRVSLENVHLIRMLRGKLHELTARIPEEGEAGEIAWLRKTMFDLQEEERFRIATDLHDTTMQDIFLLKRKLANFQKQDITDSAQQQKLQSCIEHLEAINMNLRHNCFELNPHLLHEIGLVRSIEKLVDFEAVANDFELRFETEQAQLIERIDLKIKKQLFRIVQEMLNNAKKHSGASVVTIRLTADNDSLRLYYQDDGTGLESQRFGDYGRRRTLANSGLGMEQMKSRILLIGGRWDIQSKPGEGVIIDIRVPLDESKKREPANGASSSRVI